MSNIIKYDGLLAFHPGSYIENVVEDLNITQREFAERLDINHKVLSELINGDTPLKADVALKLEKVTGMSYQMWMNLQNAYEKKKLEIEKAMQDDEIKVLSLINFRYFKENNFIEAKRYNTKEKVETLRNLFNISNLCYLKEFNPAVSYRNTSDFDESTIVNSNIMLEIATNIARNKADKGLDKKKLKSILPSIREMLFIPDDSFYSRLEAVLLECGVVLVGLPNLTNSGLQGATKRFKNGSVLLLITDRNKSADIFWFSLMHEIAHILNSDFYTDKEDEDKYMYNETKADQWAEDFLIPKNAYDDFIKKSNFDLESIKSFAYKMRLLTCIVIGRLKKDGYVKHNQFNEFKIRYYFN